MMRLRRRSSRLARLRSTRASVRQPLAFATLDRFDRGRRCVGRRAIHPRESCAKDKDGENRSSDARDHCCGTVCGVARSFSSFMNRWRSCLISGDAMLPKSLSCFPVSRDAGLMVALISYRWRALGMPIAVIALIASL